MKRCWRTFALCAAMTLSALLLAHHNFADLYLEADTIEIDGEVVEFRTGTRTPGFTCRPRTPSARRRSTPVNG